MSKKKLTDKQERFCLEYVVDFNATQAAIRSGYSEKTANAIGSENLTKGYLVDFIKELIGNKVNVKLKRKIANKIKDRKRKIYLIRFGKTDFYKIGTSMNVDSRIKSMNSSSPIDLHLIESWFVVDSFSCEKAIHSKFDNVRHKFEWFNFEGLTENKLLNEIDVVVDKFKSKER
jgi:hypothetical protein